MTIKFIQQVTQEESKLNSIMMTANTFQCSKTYKPSWDSIEKSAYDNKFPNLISTMNDDTLLRLKQWEFLIVFNFFLIVFILILILLILILMRNIILIKHN